MNGLMQRLRTGLGRLAFVAVLMASASAAHAGLMTYTLSGTGSGFLGETSFSNSIFAFTLTSDTTLLTPVSTVTLTPTGDVAFAIAGLGSGTASDLNFGANAANGIAGIARGTTAPGLTGSNASLVGYRMDTEIGPTLLDLYSSTINNLATTLGTLSLTTVTGLTFTAVNTPVPEPATLGLLAIALIGFGLAQRRRAA